MLIIQILPNVAYGPEAAVIKARESSGKNITTASPNLVCAAAGGGKRERDLGPPELRPHAT